MRQGNGSDVLGPNDPRSQKIGLIYVTANDEHKNVLTAILTQEKVGRERIAVVLPAQNKAFQRPADFDGLKSLRKKLHAQVVFVAPSGSPPANFARHRNFTVFSSLEGFTQSLEETPAAEAEPKPTGFLGGIFKRGEKKSATPAKKNTPQTAPSTGQDASEPPSGSGRRKSQEVNPVVLGGAAAAVGAAMASRPPQRDAQQLPRIVDAEPVSPSKAAPTRATPTNNGPLDDSNFDEVANTPNLDEDAEPIGPVKGRPQPLDFDPAFDDEGDLLAPPTPEQMDEQLGNKGPGLQRAGMMRAEDYETVDMPLEDDEATPRPFSLRRETPPAPRPSRELQEAGPRRRTTGKTGRGRISPRDENEEGTGRGTGLAGLGAAAAVGGALGAKALANSRSGAPEPEPIDLTVAPRRRTTVNLKSANPEGAATAAALASKRRPSGKIDKKNVNDDPATRTSKRNSGKIVAAGAAGLAAGEALASGSRNTGKTAAVGAGTGAATLPNNGGGGGLPPTRGGGGGGRGSGGGRFQPNQRQKRRGLPWVIVAVVVLVLLAACGMTAYAQPALRTQVLHAITGQSPATVTITPDSQLVKNDYIVNGVTTNPDPAKLEVSARQISATVQSNTRTVNGSGHKQTPGIRASGRLTFTNGSFTSFTVAGGTTIVAKNGVSVVIDGPAIIPPQDTGTGLVGSTSVSAHAADPGANGNIASLQINKGCCSASNSVFVKNLNAFSGGQDPQNYTFVTNDEAGKVANDLQTQTTQSALTKLRGQIQNGEEMASNPQCQPSAPKYSQPIGDTGTNVPSTSVSVSVTCTAQVYNRQQLQSLVASKLQDKANTDLGSGYKLVGKIQTRAVQQRQNDKGISWVMEARGLWVYQITTSIEQELARHIAGKRVNEAQTILSSTKGVGKVNNIQVDGNTLPSDPNQITFTIQNIEGLGDVPPGQGTPTVTAPSATPQGGKGRRCGVWSLAAAGRQGPHSTPQVIYLERNIAANAVVGRQATWKL
ncbi:hypothetical protein [Ktedonobacter robiniae]|nr:hypothetical protein [Ktedonobacter robiniae]